MSDDLKRYGELGETLAACVSAEVETVISQRYKHEALLADLDEIILPAELARKIKTSAEQVYILARSKKIPFFSVGKRDVRFLKTEIIRWMQAGGAAFDSVNENESSFSKDEREKIHKLKVA